MEPRRQKESERPRPRFYLVTPATTEVAVLKFDLLTAVASADIAAVLLRLPDADERALINRVKAIAPAVQNAGSALILDGHAEIVARAGADGAHLTGFAAFDDAVARLKPDRIAGAGGLQTRHDAMLAAERGADYVMFGEPDARGARPSFDAIVERVAWWAEVFEAPCVGYAASRAEIASLAQAGADFIAIGDFIFADPRGIGPALRAAMECLRLGEAVA